MDKTIVGLTERVKILGKKEKEILAKIDTGANYNSISLQLASELELGPIIKTVTIKTSNGKEIRPVIRVRVNIKNKVVEGLFNITDRSHLKYPILIGQQILKHGFLIDPSKK